MSDVNIDALADSHYASRDPQYEVEDPDQRTRDLYEDIDCVYDDAESAMDSFEKIRKQYRVSCVSAQEVSEAFDRLLDCLNDLKGEIASEISDF